MAKITSFEEIVAWQKSRLLVNEIYRLSGSGPFNRDFALRDQTRRAALSVMSNIAEGFARRTSREFANFLNVAAGSTAEVRSLLYVAQDVGYVGKGDRERLRALSGEISNIVKAFARYLHTGQSKRLP